MNSEEYKKIQAEYEKTGFPGLCDRRSSECSPSTLATKMWGQQLHTSTGFNAASFSSLSASEAASSFDDEEIYLFCDFHAPKNAKPIGDHLAPGNLLETVSRLSGPGFAKLRSSLSGGFGIRLESTGARAIPAPLTQIIFQTLDASPENPYVITFDQHILDLFTGAGQFDLVERDAMRRVFDGTSEGGTPVLNSATMNWQEADVDEIIQVGRNPGRFYRILSLENPARVLLSDNITLPSIDLALTMDGSVDSEVTIATNSGFTDGATVGGWSRFVKLITSDKVYSVKFVPGDAGDGAYSITARALYGGFIDPDPTPLPT